MKVRPVKLPFPRGCMGIPPGQVRGPCAMGVDVRYGSWDVTIADVLRPTIDHLVMRVVFIGKLRDNFDIMWLQEQYPVRCGVIDCRPEATIVAQMIAELRRAGRQWWRAQYNPGKSNVLELVNEKQNLITLEKTMVLNETFYAMQGGRIALPVNYDEVTGGAFRDEMKANTRAPVIFHGEEWDRWQDDCPDHSFHSLSYCFHAARKGKLWLPRSSEHLMASKGEVASTIGHLPATGLARLSPAAAATLAGDDPDGLVWEDDGEMGEGDDGDGGSVWRATF